MRQLHSDPVPQALAAAGPFPKVYAVVPHGDCMEPLYKHGVPLIISSTAKVEAGDVVIVHLKPEAQGRWGFEAIVKRLRYGLNDMTFPWDPRGSNCIIPLCLEQLNPPRTHDVAVNHVLAVHKVLGAGTRGADGAALAPRTMVEGA